MNEKAPQPSWDDFVGRMKAEWPEMEPMISVQEWMNLYAVFKMGYGAALEDVTKLLEQETSEPSPANPP